jgi:hypothetical protein
MATVQCIVNHVGRKVVRTFHIQLDQNDKLEMMTGTPPLALKSEDAAGSKLIKVLNGRANLNIASAKGNTNIYDIPPVRVSARKRGAKSNAKAGPKLVQFPCTIALPASKVAHFQCGYREGAKFEPYPNGQGQSFPVVP